MEIEEYLINAAKEAAEELNILVVDKHVDEVSLELLKNVVCWVVGSNINAGETLSHERSGSLNNQGEIMFLKDRIKELEQTVLQYKSSVATRRNVDIDQVSINNSGSVVVSCSG